MRKVSLIGIILSFGCCLNAEDIPFQKIGVIQPRHAKDIAANNWSVGGETMDRDYILFDEFRDFLGPLGVKKIRLQGGWAKCEQYKGFYNFAWLDEIIDGVIAQGVDPWLQTSYGNPIYEGGGNPNLSGGFPTSEVALTAWDRWVSAMAQRYQDKVKVWEIWNEPENNKVNTAEQYAKLYIRTAEIIRGIIPDAALYAFSFGRMNDNGPAYVEKALEYIKNENKLHLIDEITLHGYTYNPSDVYPQYEKFKALFTSYADHIKIRQGELGCPSEFQTKFALRNHNWTELTQAKWALRKLLGDLGRDIPSSYYVIIDNVYTEVGENTFEPLRNTKGLIKADIHKKFVSLKQSYYAVQHVTSIFDHTLTRIDNYEYNVDVDVSLSVFAYEHKQTENQIVTIWMDSEIPSFINFKSMATFNFPNGNFDTPVYVDLRTGFVYDIPDSNISHRGTNYTFKNIPVYDSPICIAASSLLLIENEKTSVESLENQHPLAFKLDQNYPNPFNPGTTILYELSTPGHTQLHVYDIQGKLVDTLVYGYQRSGTHNVQFSGDGLPSGAYFYTLSAGALTITRKMLLLR